MKSRSRLLIPVLVTPALAITLNACGGGGDNDPQSDIVVIADPNPEVSFFNDETETEYVDAMIGRFASLFRPLSSLVGDTEEKRRTVAATETESDNCSGGGSITATLTTDDATEELESASIDFNNCVEDGETSNGSISVSSSLDETGDNGTISLSANNFAVTGGEEDVSIDGGVTVQMQSDSSGSTFSISGSSISIAAGGDSITLSNYSLTAIDNEAAGTGSLSASMTLASSADGTITFAVDPPLTSSDTSDFPVGGRIEMTHSDGSSLTMDADNGDPETFDYTINDNGAISTGRQRWDETELDGLAKM